MVPIKRIFCVLLALVFLLTAPGVVPVKTEAVAVADDVALLSLALLFTTWAGVTFTQSDQAVTAMQNFLTTKAAAATTLTGLVTKTVLDGAKLLITGDVRTAFREVLPEIKDFFKTESDVVNSSNAGSLLNSFVVGASYPCVVFDKLIYSQKDFGDTPVLLFSSDSIESFLLSSDHLSITFFRSIDSSGNYRFDSNSRHLATMKPGTYFGIYSGFGSKGREAATFCYFEDYLSRSSLANFGFAKGDLVSLTILESSDSIPFHTSKEVDGTSALGSLDSADLDTSDKTLSIAPVTGVISNGVAGSTAAPGLSAEDLEKALAEALAGGLVVPTTPLPSETTPPDDDSHDKHEDITPTLLGGLVGSILGGLTAILDRMPLLLSEAKLWLEEQIQALKDWFEIKIQNIGDWWTDFWADTIAAVKALGASATEFFTVTFPAWVTDVKAWAATLPRIITDAIIAALAAVFVPSAGFVDAKVAILAQSFPFVNSIILSGKALGSAFTGFYTEPPIIWAELHNATTSYSWGDRAIILDLRWYAQYKPTVDILISGFLWALFVWKIFQKLPGIINGLPGDFVMDSLNSAGMVDHLPTRKEAYEIERVNNRQRFWRSKK